MQPEGNYFFFKHPANFSDKPEIVLLSNNSEGDSYRVIYERLIEMSVNKGGYVLAENGNPYSLEQLTILTRRNKSDEALVKEAIDKLSDLSLIDIDDKGIIRIVHIDNYIGKGSIEYDKKKARKKAKEDQSKDGQMSDKCPTNVREESEYSPKVVREKSVYIDIDSEKEIDKEKEYIISSIPPSFEEFELYCKAFNPEANAKDIYKYYSEREWKIGNRIMNFEDLKEKVKSWKQFKPNKQQSFIAAEEMQYEEVDLEELRQKMFGDEK